MVQELLSIFVKEIYIRFLHALQPSLLDSKYMGGLVPYLVESVTDAYS